VRSMDENRDDRWPYVERGWGLAGSLRDRECNKLINLRSGRWVPGKVVKYVVESVRRGNVPHNEPSKGRFEPSPCIFNWYTGGLGERKTTSGTQVEHQEW
jgi:hypothetical protein